MNIRILNIGDLVGNTGIAILQKHVEYLKSHYKPDVLIVNGENSAHDGKGITPKVCQTLFDLGVTVITTGNHIWGKKEIIPFMETESAPLLRPANFPAGCPGVGVTIIQAKQQPVAVVNLQGRVFMRELLDCPFRAIDSILTYLKNKAKIIIIDFHAETTAEKNCFSYYVDGRVSAVVGTHTHVQTADERILPGGTAYITDLGMVGSLNSSIGMKKDALIHQFLTQMPVRYIVEEEPPLQLNGAVIDIDSHTGKATHIERIRIVE